MGTINGTSGNDTLNGTYLEDTINGFDGNDTIYGDDGADTIDGDGGNDTIDGGGSWDTIHGGAGDDIIYGDHPFMTDDGPEFYEWGGEDVLYGGDGNDILYGGAGSAVWLGDRFWDGNGDDFVYGGPDMDTIFGQPGNDYYDGGIGSGAQPDLDTVDYRFASAGVIIEWNGSSSQARSSGIGDPAGIGLDTIVNVEAISGTSFDDQMTAAPAGMNLYGHEGDDTLSGGVGWDRISGGPGDDIMSGGDGDGAYDTVVFASATGPVHVSLAETGPQDTGEGIDQITGFESVAGADNYANFLVGTAGPNELDGGNAADELYGAASNDSLMGGGGNDYLDGGAGADFMYGGTDDDTYAVDDVDDHTREAYDEGIDTVVSPISWILPSIALTAPHSGYAFIENLELTGTNSINGTGNELDNGIVGNDAANSLFGNAGADSLSGGAGNDLLRGGTGNDDLDGGDGSDRMYGGVGNDSYVVSDAGDFTYENVGEGVDRVLASVALTLASNIEELVLTGSDKLAGAGNTLANVLTGNDANNRLYGKAGSDTLLGGGGDDSLFGGAGSDSMAGGVGNDIYSVAQAGDSVHEEAGEGNDYVYAEVSYVLPDNVERLYLVGSGPLDGTGNSGANVITGNAYANVLGGGAGDDSLYGDAGADTLQGGAGIDDLHGGRGDDTYIVSDATDYAYENADEGNDVVLASVSATLRANIEQLVLTGTDAIDGIGNELANVITGNSAANGLAGMLGNDGLYGGGGADELRAGAGNDWLEGGAGRDDLYGGTGLDRFVFRDGDFGGATAGSADVIHDFSQAEHDLIRLDYVDADTATGGDQGFDFIGAAAFTGAAGELRYEIVDGNTYVTGDTDGDATADFMIRLDGSHTLTSGDFILG